MNCGVNELWRLLLITTLVPIFTQALHDEDLRPSLSCLLMGDYGCKCKCALLCKMYGCVDWNPSCDSVYCDCKEQWKPIVIEPDIVKEYEGLVDLDDVLAVRFKRTPSLYDLEDVLYENPDLMDEVVYFLRHTHGHGKPFKDQFRLTFPELDYLLKRLKPRPLKEQKGPGQNSEVPNEPLGNLDPPKSRFGFLADWWNKPSAQSNSKENKERIINMVNGVDNKEDLLSTLKMLKDSGDTPLYTDITKHFLKNGLIIADGTRILEPISDSKALKKSLANDGILRAIEDKIKEEEELKRGKKRKQMQSVLPPEKKPKTQAVAENNLPDKKAVSQPQSSFWGIPNWFSSKSTASQPPEIKNTLPQTVLPQVKQSEYNFGAQPSKPSDKNNQYLPYDDSAESIYDDGYYSENSQEKSWPSGAENSLPPTFDKNGIPEYSTQSNYNLPAHELYNQPDDFSQFPEFHSEYPPSQNIEFIDQEYLNKESNIPQTPTPVTSTIQSNVSEEPDWFSFSWERDNFPISPIEEDFLKNETPISHGSLPSQLENNSYYETPIDMKLDEPVFTESPYFFADSTQPQEINKLNGDQEVIALPNGLDLGPPLSDESSDGRNLNFFFNKLPAEEPTKQIPSAIPTPIMSENILEPEESDEYEGNAMLQNFLKLANVPVNDGMPNDEDTMSIGTRNLGPDRGIDELQLSNLNTKPLEPLPVDSPILDDASHFDDDYIIERTHLTRLSGIIPDSSESTEYIPVTRIIKKKKNKPTETPTGETPVETVADKSKPKFSTPQTTSVKFEGLPGSPVVQIDGLPFQQFNSNSLPNAVPKSSTQPYFHSKIPEVESTEKPDSHISEALKNVLPSYITDDFSASIEDMNEPENINDRNEQQLPISSLKSGTQVPTYTAVDGSILPIDNLDGSNNPLLESIKKLNPNLLNDTPLGKFNADVNLTPEGILLGEPLKKVAKGGRNNPIWNKDNAELNPNQDLNSKVDKTAFIPELLASDVTKPLIGQTNAYPQGDSEMSKNPITSAAESPVSFSRKPTISKNRPLLDTNPVHDGINNIPNILTNQMNSPEDIKSKNKTPLTSSILGIMPDIDFESSNETVLSNFLPQNNIIPSRADSSYTDDTDQDFSIPNMEETRLIPLNKKFSDKDSLSESITKPKTASPGDQFQLKSSPFYAPQDLDDLEPSNISPLLNSNSIPEYETEFSKPIIPSKNDSKRLNNPLSEQIPGRPSNDKKPNLGPTEMKISDNLAEPQTSNPASKYSAKPVNPSKTLKNSDKKLPTIPGDQKIKNGGTSSPPSTAIPGKSNKSVKNGNPEKEMFQNNIPDKKTSPSYPIKTSPDKKTIAVPNPMSLNDESANPHQLENLNSAIIQKLGLPEGHMNVPNEEIDFDNFFKPMKDIPLGKNKPEDGAIDLSSILGLYDQNLLEDLPDQNLLEDLPDKPNNEISEVPGNRYLKDIEDIFDAPSQADIPKPYIVNQGDITPNIIPPSNDNKVGMRPEAGNPAFTSDDSFFADDSTFDDFFKESSIPLSNDDLYSKNEDSSPLNQNLKDLDDIFNNEKPKSTIPLNKLDNSYGLGNPMTDSNGNPLTYKVDDGIEPSAPSQVTNVNDGKSNLYSNTGKNQQPDVGEISSSKLSEEPDFDDFFKSLNSPSADNVKPADSDFDLNMFMGIDGLDDFKDLMDNGFGDEKKNEAAELDDFSGLNDLLDNTDSMPINLVGKPSTTTTNTDAPLELNGNNFSNLPSHIPSKGNEDFDLFSIIDSVDNPANDLFGDNKQNQENDDDIFSSQENFLDNFGEFDLPDKYKQGLKKKAPIRPDVNSQTGINNDQNKNLPNDEKKVSASAEPSFDDFNILSLDSTENNEILGGGFDWSSFPGVDDNLNGIFNKDANGEKPKSTLSSLPSEYDFSGPSDLDKNLLGSEFLPEATKGAPELQIFTPTKSGVLSENEFNDSQPDSANDFNDEEFPFLLDKKNKFDKKRYLPNNLLNQPGNEANLVTLPQNDSEISTFDEFIPYAKVVNGPTPQKLPIDFIESLTDGADEVPLVTKLFPNLISSDEKYFPEENLVLPSALPGSNSLNGKDISGSPIKIPGIDTSLLQDGGNEILSPDIADLLGGGEGNRNTSVGNVGSLADKKLPYGFKNLKDEKLPKEFSEMKNALEALDNLNLAQPLLLPNISSFPEEPGIISPNTKPNQKPPKSSSNNSKPQGKSNPNQKPPKTSSNKPPSTTGNQNIPSNSSTFPSVTSTSKPSSQAKKLPSPAAMASKKLPNDNSLGRLTADDLKAAQQLFDLPMSTVPDDISNKPYNLVSPETNEKGLSQPLIKEMLNKMEKASVKSPKNPTNLNPASNTLNLLDSPVLPGTENIPENNLEFPEDLMEFLKNEKIETSPFDGQFPFIMSPTNRRKQKNSDLFPNLFETPNNTSQLGNEMTGDNILELPQESSIPDDVFALLSETQSYPQIDSIKPTSASTLPEVIEDDFLKNIFDTKPLMEQTIIPTDPNQDTNHDNEQWDRLLERLPFLDADVYPSSGENPISKPENDLEKGDLAANVEVDIEENPLSVPSETLSKSDFPIPQAFDKKLSRYPKKKNILNDLPLTQNLLDPNQIYDQMEMSPPELQTDILEPSPDNQLSELLNYYPDMNLIPDDIKSNFPSESIMSPEMVATNLRNDQPTSGSTMTDPFEIENVPPIKQKPKIEKSPRIGLKNQTGAETPTINAEIMNTPNELSQYSPIENGKESALPTSLDQDLENTQFLDEMRNLQLSPSEAELENEGPLNFLEAIKSDSEKEPIDLSQPNAQWPMIEKSSKKTLLKRPDVTPEALYEELLPDDTFQSFSKPQDLNKILSPEEELMNILEPNNIKDYKNVMAPEKIQYLNNIPGKLDDDSMYFENPASDPLGFDATNIEFGFLPLNDDFINENNLLSADSPGSFSLPPMKKLNQKRPTKPTLGDPVLPGTLSEDFQASLVPQVAPKNPYEKESYLEDISELKEVKPVSSPSAGTDISDFFDNTKSAYDIENDSDLPAQPWGDLGLENIGQSVTPSRPKKELKFESGDIDSADEDLLQQMMKGWPKDMEKPAKIPPIVIDDSEISLLPGNNDFSNNLDDINLDQMIYPSLSDFPYSNNAPLITSDQLKAAQKNPKISDTPEVPSKANKGNINFGEDQKLPKKSTIEDIFDLEKSSNAETFSENFENLTPQNEFPSSISPLSQSEAFQPLIPQGKKKPEKFKKIMDILNPESANKQDLQNNADVPLNLSELSTPETADLTKTDDIPEIPNDIRFSIDNETGEISSIVVPAQSIDLNKTPILDNENFLDDSVLGKAPILQDSTLSGEPSYSDMGISNQNFSEANDIPPELPMTLMDILKLNDLNSAPEFNLDKSINRSADLPTLSKPTTKINHTPDNNLASEFEALQEQLTEPSELQPPVSLMDILNPNNSDVPEFNFGNTLDNQFEYLPNNIPDNKPSRLNQITPVQKFTEQSDTSSEPPMSLMDILKLNDFDVPSELNQATEPYNKPVILSPKVNSNLPTNNQKPNIVKPSLPKSIPSKLNDFDAPSELNSNNELNQPTEASNKPVVLLPKVNSNLPTNNQKPSIVKPSLPKSQPFKLNDFDAPSKLNSNNELNQATEPSNTPVILSPKVNSNLPTNNQKPNIVKPSLPKSTPSNSQQPPSTSSSNLLKNKSDGANVPNAATVPQIKAPVENPETIITKKEPILPAPSKPIPGPTQSMKKPITPRPMPSQSNQIRPQTSLGSNIESLPKKPAPDNIQQQINDLMSSFPEETEGSLLFDPYKMNDPLMLGLGQPVRPKNTIKPINDNTNPPRNSGPYSQPSKPTQQPVQMNSKPMQPVNSKPSPMQVNSKPQTLPVNSKPSPMQVNSNPQIQSVNSKPSPMQVNSKPQTPPVNSKPSPMQVNSKPQTQPVNSKPPPMKASPLASNRPTPATNNTPTNKDLDFEDPFAIFAPKEKPAANSVPSQVGKAPKFDFDGFGDLDILVGDDKFTEQEMMLAAKNPKIRPDILLSAQNAGNTPMVEKPPKPGFAKRG